MGRIKQPRRDIQSKYRKGQQVFVFQAGVVDPKPYQIHEVLADEQYRLLRDGDLDSKIYRVEELEELDVLSVPELGIPGSQNERRNYEAVGPNPEARSLTQASRAKADIDKTGLRLKDAKVDKGVQDSVGRVAAVIGPSRRPIKQEVRDSEPSMAPGPTFRLDEIGNEDTAKEQAENIRLGTGEAKELGDEASPPKLVGENSEEASAKNDQPNPRSSREDIKRQNIRSVPSRFGLRERPLETGKKRVRWQCGCGRKMYDDFTELRSGAAAELEKWLNDSIRKHAVSSASDSQQSASQKSAASPNRGSSGHLSTAESDISLQPLGPGNNVVQASNDNAAVALDVHLEKCWLILCGNMKRGPDILLTQLNLSSTPSDKSLFDSMKSVYSDFRKFWTLRSFLRGVKAIRFVHFQLHKAARVDIRKTPDMPPETKRDEYLFEPCDLIPPVGENFMTHWFHHPDEAWDLLYAYSLFPKRRKGELEIDLNHAPRVGWGIQIVEGWLGYRLWLLSLSVFLGGSLAFAICWTILRHDIQGAFGVSAYIVALLTLTVGAAQASLG